MITFRRLRHSRSSDTPCQDLLYIKKRIKNPIYARRKNQWLPACWASLFARPRREYHRRHSPHGLMVRSEIWLNKSRTQNEDDDHRSRTNRERQTAPNRAKTSNCYFDDNERTNEHTSMGCGQTNNRSNRRVLSLLLHEADDRNSSTSACVKQTNNEHNVRHFMFPKIKKTKWIIMERNNHSYRRHHQHRQLIIIKKQNKEQNRENMRVFIFSLRIEVYPSTTARSIDRRRSHCA